MRNRGAKKATVATMNGILEISRRVYGSKEQGWVYPADSWLGIVLHRISVGIRQWCCLEALDSSMATVARSVESLSGIRLSEERVRGIVESEGAQVASTRNTGQLGASFTTEDCADDVMVSGTDGVLVPVVPETQKAKRRATEARKRIEQGRRSTRRPGRPKRGADGAYKEAKIVTFYDQVKTGLHVATTMGNHDVLGRIMRREARKVKLGDAKFSYAVADGAKWIAKQYQKQLPMLDEQILDWYHFREHIVEASHTVYGEHTAKAKAFQQKMLDAAWQQGSLAMLHKLSHYERRHKGDKRKALGKLRQYVQPRIAMTDYPAFRASGYDCGSGPTESQCGTLAARVKGPGMRWSPENAAAMLALAALDHSNLWKQYWAHQRAA